MTTAGRRATSVNGNASHGKDERRLVIGVLALQGDFAEHEAALKRLGADVVEVRLPRDLEGLDALIIPGGESTTMARLLDLYGLRKPVRDFAGRRPVWGTCAGLILLADRLTDDRPEPLHLMDVTVSRNAFGRQVDSFEADLDVDGLSGPAYRAVFIRAPKIIEVGGKAHAVATLPDGAIVAVRQGSLLGTAFHPELTSDDRVHKLFLDIVEKVARA